MKSYQLNSPLLFLIFNRPDTTLEVFEMIKKVKPSRLYIAADGPRRNKAMEANLCIESRAILSRIDWDCEVKTLFRNENLGCKLAVSTAIDWFFEQEEEGIILEDDCLPALSFFYFCDQMLEKYRKDERIRHISGCNLHSGKTWGEASYYFTESTNIWGWASWRRVWKDYDRDLVQYQESDVRAQLSKIFYDDFLAEQWINIFKELKADKINTWDFQLAFLNYFNHGLSVNPNVNLITNIGFRADATHTPNPNAPYSRLPLHEMTEITHPKYMLAEKQADYEVFQKEFHLEERRKKHFSYRRRFKRWLKKRF
ncbi:nucleotide-diphospho-sugar transferase [Pedobacter sp. MC2016-24]|uniref:nucleotide-diphospho-sugar transferase n=1 Tax=Pedobacter sp. MC2016-24 TaxID=2780090 RepID=UPI00188215A8|nr:nucleotide-diphospho-sugar transferase [Pedobacter sp. MC2016-24]MBE9598805.1 nucleotide-diphospho-sugar transferase [Pedobacter sp. MC2016-24]